MTAIPNVTAVPSSATTSTAAATAATAAFTAWETEWTTLTTITQPKQTADHALIRAGYSTSVNPLIEDYLKAAETALTSQIAMALTMKSAFSAIAAAFTADAAHTHAFLDEIGSQ